MTDAAPDAPASDIKKPSKTGQLFLASLATVAYFGVLCLAMFQPIPDKNHDIVITMLSVAGSVLMGTWAYYFGSSIGSRMKDEALSKTPQSLSPIEPGEEKNKATANVTIQTAGG